MAHRLINIRHRLDGNSWGESVGRITITLNGDWDCLMDGLHDAIIDHISRLGSGHGGVYTINMTGTKFDSNRKQSSTKRQVK